MRRERDHLGDQLVVLQTIPFAEVMDVSVPRHSTLMVMLNNREKQFYYSHRAVQIKTMIDEYCSEAEKSEKYVRAIVDYSTSEPTLLSFRKGDVIRVTQEKNQYLDRGWLYGNVDGRYGMFPMEYVEPLRRNDGYHEDARLERMVEVNQNGRLPQQHARHERLESRHDNIVESKQVLQSRQQQQQQQTNNQHLTKYREDHQQRGQWQDVNKSQYAREHAIMLQQQQQQQVGWQSHEFPDETDFDITALSDGKFSMMEFAILNFRQSLEKYAVLQSQQGNIKDSIKIIESLKDGKQWNWQEQADMVKYTNSPIQNSLLFFEDAELSALSVKTFRDIMAVPWATYPLGKDRRTSTGVHIRASSAGIAMASLHRRQSFFLSNSSAAEPTAKSCKRVRLLCPSRWRLLRSSLLAAYFSNARTRLKARYAIKYLQTAAFDSRRPYHGTASNTLNNLRKTFRYGGRKNVPSADEVINVTLGRNAKRQIYIIPGGTEKIVNIKSSTVVDEVIEDICETMNLTRSPLADEFSLYYVLPAGMCKLPGSSRHWFPAAIARTLCY
ncbi:PREDICTED: unconventional myosin-XV-like [Priapulus caudatus]|uniref:Unconventional myosin-XV-like n=1 Tax=Priapulus caudatus TaxID=37621 RepID=A0ABM1ETI3_PRICU|nr:PREDICTED: unconventional myosin-XV-like [Priapulus caudatus]